MSAFAPVTGESLVVSFRFWDRELDSIFSQKQAETWIHLTTAGISTFF